MVGHQMSFFDLAFLALGKLAEYSAQVPPDMPKQRLLAVLRRELNRACCTPSLSPQMETGLWHATDLPVLLPQAKQLSRRAKRVGVTERRGLASPRLKRARIPESSPGPPRARRSRRPARQARWRRASATRLTARGRTSTRRRW
jgi:hypothetical protein